MAQWYVISSAKNFTKTFKNTTSNTVKITSITLKFGIAKDGQSVYSSSSTKLEPIVIDSFYGTWEGKVDYSSKADMLESLRKSSNYDVSSALSTATKYTGTGKTYDVIATCGSSTTSSDTITTLVKTNKQYAFSASKVNFVDSDPVHDKQDRTMWYIYSIWDGTTYATVGSGSFVQPTTECKLTFDTPITLASGASTTITLTCTPTEGRTILVRNGGDGISVNYETITPTDNGPYYPWYNYYDDSEGQFKYAGEEASITDGIDGAMVYNGSKWAAAYSYDAVSVYNVDSEGEGWQKYEKYLQFEGSSTQISTLPFKWLYKSGSVFEMEFSIPETIAANDGYMLAEICSGSTGKLRIGLFSKNGAGNYYIYINNASGDSKIVRTEEVLNKGTRYHLRIAKSSTTTSIQIYNVNDSTESITVSGTAVGDVSSSSYTTYLFNAHSLSGREFKGTIYKFSFYDSTNKQNTYDLNLCSVGYNKIKQTDYNTTTYKFTGSNDISSALSVLGRWVAID